MGKQVWSAVCTLEQGAPYFDNYARREQEIFFRFVSAFHELTITLDQSPLLFEINGRGGKCNYHYAWSKNMITSPVKVTGDWRGIAEGRVDSWKRG